jgi:homoserine O-acetyltransferase/O-succinyltransferase
MSNPYSTAQFDSLALESGQVLDRVDVAYQTWGALNSTRDNAVVVFHSMSGDSNAASWWSSIIGPGKAICTDRYFVVCANLLGSCYGTSGPTSINPKTGQRYAADFPICTVRDQVRIQVQLLERLGVNRVECVIGGSLGGFLALEWSFIDPTVRNVIAVTTSGRHSAWCIAWTEAQRQAIYTDPNWNGGHYDEANPPASGLAAARMMAMISYRNPSSFTSRFGRDVQEDDTFSVTSYLNHQGQKLVNRFDANSYVRLTQTSNSHDISRNRGSYLEVLRSIKQKVLVVGVDTDVLFPLQEQQELAEAIPNADLAVIESPHGHDAFLLEGERLNDIVKKWLRVEKKSTFQPPFSTVSCA